MRISNEILRELIKNNGCREGSITPINPTGIVRLALDLQSARNALAASEEESDEQRDEVSKLREENDKFRKALKCISDIGEREDVDTDDLLRAVAVAGQTLK